MKALEIQPYELGFMREEVLLYERNAHLSLILVSRKKEISSKLLILVPFFSSPNRGRIVGRLVDNNWPTFLDWMELIYQWSLGGEI